MLPDACMDLLIESLSPRDLAAVRCTCKSWKALLSLALKELHLELPLIPDIQKCLAKFPIVDELHIDFSGRWKPSVTELEDGARALQLTKIVMFGGKVLRKCSAPVLHGKHLEDVLALSPKLICLELIGFELGIKELHNCLSSCLELRTLRLRHLILTIQKEEAVRYSLSNRLSLLRNLRIIEVKYLAYKQRIPNFSGQESNDMPKALTGETLSCLKGLRELRMEGDGSVINLGTIDCIGQLSHLEVLDVEFTGLPAVRNHDRLANSNARFLGHQLLDRLFTNLRHLHESLIHLEIKSRHNAQVHCLDVLSTLTNLQRLTIDLGWNTLSLMGSLQVLHDAGSDNPDAMWRIDDFQFLTNLRRLKSLSVSKLDLHGRRAVAFSAFRTLSALEFVSCHHLDDNDMFDLANISSIRRLGIVKCTRISDLGIAALAKGPIHHQLQALDLSDSHRNITNTGIAALGTLTALRELNLKGCERLTDEGIVELVKSVTGIVCLNLSDCSITDTSCRALSRQCRHLESLNIEHCERITDQSVLCLASLTQLRWLQAFGSGISRPGADALRGLRGTQTVLDKECWWAAKGQAMSWELPM